MHFESLFTVKCSVRGVREKNISTQKERARGKHVSLIPTCLTLGKTSVAAIGFRGFVVLGLATKWRPFLVLKYYNSEIAIIR